MDTFEAQNVSPVISCFLKVVVVLSQGSVHLKKKILGVEE